MRLASASAVVLVPSVLGLSGCTRVWSSKASSSPGNANDVSLGLDAGVAATLRPILAPTGALRVGVSLGSPTSLVRNAQGQAAGLAWELGNRLASALGVPFTPVELARVADIVEAMSTNNQTPRVDFTFTNATAARAQVVDFTEPLLSLELGYLVPASSVVQSIGALDQTGRRIGVTLGSSSQAALPRVLQAATVVPVDTVSLATSQMRRGELDAFATNKAILFEMADALPGSRVLGGRWGLEHLAIAVPKGRNAAVPALQRWVNTLKQSGELARMASRAGLRGIAGSS
jgi:polar amino acid transport system substrate-binding protein